MVSPHYLMEHDDEALRLDLKTDSASVRRQARWAGIRSGMKVADIGCGSGKTTHYLHQLVQPEGQVVGVDVSAARIQHAEQLYKEEGLQFVCRDFTQPLHDLGEFDFIWVRFVLEYHCSRNRAIVGNLSEILKPGGILCLIDLDHNCLNHFGLSHRLEHAIRGIMNRLQDLHDFDPYAGRKLYSFMYDLGLEDIAVDLSAHHLIYGAQKEVDAYNWTMKVEVAAKNSGYPFDEYPGGYKEFREEFRNFFSDPRRFTYTPLIACRGRKPLTHSPGPRHDQDMSWSNS